MFNVQVKLGNLPIVLVCMMDATVAFVRTQDFKTIIDHAEGNSIGAVFYAEGFAIGNETYEYSTKYTYKTIPNMLQWLIQQKLEMPDLEGYRGYGGL